MSLVSLDSELYSESNGIMLYQNVNSNAFTEGVYLFIGVKLISLKIDLGPFS